MKMDKSKIVTSNYNKKRLFIGLLVGAYLTLALIGAGMWRISAPGLREIADVLPLVSGAALAVFFGLIGLGIAGLIAAAAGLPFFPFVLRRTTGLVNLLFPLVVLFGRIFGFRRRQIESSFVSVSNKIFHRMNIKVPADRLLVVTPHCLQLDTCPHKITRDPMNCKRCGRCDIAALVTMAEEMGFHFFVVTGGTLARQTVKKLRPKAVLAIACERDLTSGIQDVYPLPAVGVMNLRPNGPCFNTHVDLAEFRRELENMIILPEKKADEGAEKNG